MRFLIETLYLMEDKCKSLETAFEISTAVYIYILYAIPHRWFHNL